jgi:L-rhamnose mutarotase
LKRYGQVIGVRPDKLEYYKKLHADPWPEVLETIKKCNIDHYSIYYKDGMLYSYFEYAGDNFEEDMKKMAEDPVTQKWWMECNPCQIPLDSRKPGEWWAEMEELFHLD